jgi:hypothetical protein
MPQTHAQLPQNSAGIGAEFRPDQLIRKGLPEAYGGVDWTPTIVNPSTTGGMVEKLLFWFHLSVWVTALILSCVVNFAAPGFMSNGTNATGYSEPNSYHGISDTVRSIGIIGGTGSIVGVLVLLFAASYYTAEEFTGNPIFDENGTRKPNPAGQQGLIVNVIIQIATLFGTTCTLFIFSQAAAATANGYYGLTMTAVIFLVYAQILLYCTSSAMAVRALKRAFIPSLAVAVQFVSAMAINSGDFYPGATTQQKTIAWVIPILTLIALLMMFTLRIGTMPGGFLSKYMTGEKPEGASSFTVSNIKQRPFLRSLFLTPYLVSGILSVYQLSFVKGDSDPTSYTFAFFGMMLNFVIIGIVFNPSDEVAGIAEED